ncbi:hypothetical protein KIW84_045565 [Lathyrus oleraceus]|uniref:Uncharacterized protein n=1 Tax=Pisum sativum TaxID=3888 RepID=A0A9D4XLF9_PEA|nr:hypothetical protein KIW84_045565 [Pisum sativum]
MYASDRAVPSSYNATMVENGQEVLLPMTNVVVYIADIAKVTRSGRVFGPIFPKEVVEDVSISKKVDVPTVNPVSAPMCQSGESSKLKPNDDDEVLRLIKRTHREALQKVLEQAYVEHDVTVDQFDHIVANITACNSLSFYDEELPEEGINHNLALHISMNCKEDALSNVLVDIGSSLNVLPKSTLSRLSYQGAPMRYSGVIVKVMDIHPAYRCLLDRPWIHEAGAVTSTLHQKLKFMKNDKLVIVGGEKALLVSHLSSFTYVEDEEELGTPFQDLSIVEVKKIGAPMSSFKDAQKAIEAGSTDQWGRMVEVTENKNRVGLGFQQGPSNVKTEEVQPSFCSGGFIHGNEQHSAYVIEGDEDEDRTNFVTHDKTCNNWVAVDIPVIIHRSKLVPKPIEHNDPTPFPNFEFPVFEAEEEIDDEVSDELSRLLEHEEKAIQQFE